MDKEAQEKIKELSAEIMSLIAISNVSVEVKAEAIAVYMIRELGYRKLPKDKPPLLTKQALIDLFPDGETIYWEACNKITQAQRELDIKWYKNK